MKISVIDNEFVATMDRELRKGFAAGGTAKFATAFLTEAAVQLLDTILTDMRKHNRDLHIQLAVGLYLRFTSPNVLRRLQALQRKNATQLEVRVALNERFHWKLYLFRSRERTT
jgi:HKD family nuclease